MLLEESLAILGTQKVEQTGSDGKRYVGLQRDHEFCDVALGDDALPFVVLFSQMETESPVGSIQTEESIDNLGRSALGDEHCVLRLVEKDSRYLGKQMRHAWSFCPRHSSKARILAQLRQECVQSTRAVCAFRNIVITVQGI